MKFTQPKLPYAPDALAPAISQETINFHYGKHEKAYIDNLNRLVEDTTFADEPLEEIIKTSEGPLFNNASQAWNHIFYFFQFSPVGKRAPEGNLKEKIDKTFGSFEDFKKKFEEAGAGIFGSGWVWLSAVVEACAPCWCLTSGSTPTTSTTRTCVPHTCTPCGTSWTGT